MVFFPFIEEIFPFHLCFESLWSRIILRNYADNLILLMRNLQRIVEVDEYKQELHNLLHPLEENVRWYSDYIYPEIGFSPSTVRDGKLRLLPVGEDNLYKITTLSAVEKLEQCIDCELDRFTTRFDMKQIVDYIYSNQSSNLVVILDQTEGIIQESIARSVLTGRPVDEEIARVTTELSKSCSSLEELQYTLREMSHLNIITGTSNSQRRLRNKIEEIVSTAKSGREKPSIGDFLKFLKIIHWITKVNVLKFYLKKGIPVYFIENDIFTMAYIPQIERASLLDQQLGTIWQHRLDIHGMNCLISSTDHAYQGLLATKWAKSHQLLEQLASEFDEYPKEMVKFYSQRALSHYISLLSEIYSPFAIVKQPDDQELHFTSPIQIADAQFRFIWAMRNTEHIKVYGTSFENYVSIKLDERKQYRTLANRYFQRLQYDQLFYKEPILFVIDSKDLKIIESVDDRARMASRKHELKEYCQYLLKKTILIKDNLDEFTSLFTEFEDIAFLVPVIVTHNPEYYFEFDNVGIITLMEFLFLHETIFQSISDGQSEVELSINPVGDTSKLSYAFHFHAIEI